jgi:hypothetical protein
MSEQLDLDLDPKRILAALKDIGNETGNLAKKIEEALGKDAAKSIEKLEDTAEKGTTKITSFFRNLGTRVKEDLKTAFDMGMVLEGAKFAKDLSAGTRQVLDMERAFDKLNVRLGMSGEKLSNFKKNLGRAVSGTGQQLQDILPGVENAASKGGIKSPEQLTAIGEALGKAKAVTGEDTGSLSDTIIEVLKTQGKQINAQSFKETLDAMQATRVNGAFNTAGEAGAAIEGISPYAKQLGLNTRQLGGLAGNASMSGASGQQMLQNLLHNATGIGGAGVMNAGLGQNVFKSGNQGQAVGMDMNALSKVNFSKLSPRIMEQITGMSGANGADLQRFIESIKNGSSSFKKVVNGMDENASQFTGATDNFASKLDQFKRKTQEAALEVGTALSNFANHMLNGNTGDAGKDLKNAGKALYENKGTIAGALGATALIGMISGSSAGRLLGKVGGGAIKGQAAKAAGIAPVYVTNANEIGENIGMTDKIGMAMKSSGMALTAATVAPVAIAATAAAAISYGGYKLGEISKKSIDSNPAIKQDDRGNFTSNMMSREDVQAMKQAHIEALKESEKNKKVHFTNPSDLSGGRGKRAQ